MQIKPVAYFHSPIDGKFGIPRQAGLAPQLHGTIELTASYRCSEALKGLEGFDYLWLIWGFNLNGIPEKKLTVRPPRLGGNTRVGVFASRSPFRPNGLGLTSAKIETVDTEHCEITVSGADLADGTPIYDIKPYLSYTDSHPDARCGYVDDTAWQGLNVFIPTEVKAQFSERDSEALREILSLDPRPRYQEDPHRVYGLVFAGRNVRFTVSSGILTVIDALPEP